MKGKGLGFSVILGKEVRLYTRKRGVRLCAGVSFLYTLGKRGPFIHGSELPLHTRKRGVRLGSGVSFLYTLGKEGSVYTPEWASLYSDKGLSFTLRGSNSWDSCQRKVELKLVLLGHRCLIPHRISVFNLLIPLLHLRIGVAWPKAKWLVGNWGEGVTITETK